MKPFLVNADKNSQAHIYFLEGYFDESAKLPFLENVPLVKIHLGKVTTINSHGIRSWCLWFKTVPSSVKILIYEAPPLFVKAMNSVSGFLTPHMEVMSFYVPYYSAETGTGKNVLYSKGENYTSSTLTHPTVTGENKSPLEIDVDDTYFKFLDIR